MGLSTNRKEQLEGLNLWKNSFQMFDSLRPDVPFWGQLGICLSSVRLFLNFAYDHPQASTIQNMQKNDFSDSSFYEPAVKG